MRRLHGRTVTAACVLLAVLAVVVSCGDDGGANGTATQETPSAPAGESSRAPETVGGASAKEARRGVRLARIGTFDAPLYVTAPPGDNSRIFVVEQGGSIQVLVNGKRAARPFLDISSMITSGGEQGLLSMAFAPDYARSKRFYVNYTDRSGDTRVDEFRQSAENPNVADRSSGRQVLFVNQPFPNHNGGLVLFGPDRLLYIGMGDGGSAGDPFDNAQRLGTLLGKMLRIDPRPGGGRPYRVPRSNPFVGRAGRDEIYARGLRNPWRFSFDRATGDLYIGDVGQGSLEEIDFARRGRARGRNYGWSCFEGSRRYDTSRRCPGSLGPVLDYGRAGGACSVTGGIVARDRTLPALRGRYVYGDFCRGRLMSFRISSRGRAVDNASLGLTVGSLSSFGEDARGRVYATSLDGPVFRLTAR